LADTITLDPGAGGAVVSTDDLGAAGHVQWVKLRDGTDGGTQTIASGGGTEAASLRVTVASDSTGVLSVDDNGATLSVDDGAGSLTVDNAALSVTGGGVEATALRVTLASDSTGVVSVDDNGGSITVDGTVTANLGTAAVTNAGTFAVQESGGALTALQLIDDTILADDAAFTVGTTKVSVAGFLADQASTDSVNEGDAGAARMTLNRQQIVTVAPSSDTEGLTPSKQIDIDETEDEIKATAGKLYGWYLYNDGAAEAYVKFYNATAANVTVGTTTPTMTIPIPAGSASNIEWTNGVTFGTAICVAATTGVADNDTGAPAANQVAGTILFQ
jgi:hypothetical protein